MNFAPPPCNGDDISKKMAICHLSKAPFLFRALRGTRKALKPYLSQSPQRPQRKVFDRITEITVS